MRFKDLIEKQKRGAYKVEDVCKPGYLSVAGELLTIDQCEEVANRAGWVGRSSDSAFNEIKKVDSYVRNFASGIDNEWIRKHTDITFESSRKTDTTKISDRIKFTSPKYDLTIVHGVAGLGGRYAVFDLAVSDAFPDFACNTLDDLTDYLNHYLDEDNDEE